MSWDMRRADQRQRKIERESAGLESDFRPPEHIDYFAHGSTTTQSLQKLAAFEPRVLACMHGSAFAGDGRATLLALAQALAS